MSDELLRTEEIAAGYGPAIVLSNVSFCMQAGEVMTILGANGAGKSTLARACSGLIPISKVRLFFARQDVTGRSAYEIPRAGLVYLPEGRGILPGLSVYENLRMATI